MPTSTVPGQGKPQLTKFFSCYLPMVAGRERHLFDEWTGDPAAFGSLRLPGVWGRKIVAGLGVVGSFRWPDRQQSSVRGQVDGYSAGAASGGCSGPV